MIKEGLVDITMQRMDAAPPSYSPMMRPAPSWKLFLGWLRRPHSERVRGRGLSFFSMVPLTVHVESREPRNKRPARGTSTFERDCLFIQMSRLKIFHTYTRIIFSGKVGKNSYKYKTHNIFILGCQCNLTLASKCCPFIILRI